MADSLAMSKEKNQPAIVFGKVIKNLRLERGLTQNNLADIINSERSHISDIERSIKSVSYTHLDVYKRQSNSWTEVTN